MSLTTKKKGVIIISRKLATIRTVGKILPIEGKDRIVLAHIDGWQVIVKKDEFKEGDLAVYCEIDSVLPDKPEFEFLRKNNFRIRTMRMGGVRSEGICFPLSILPKGDYKVGDDVTEIIGIKKYESPTEQRERLQEERRMEQTATKFGKYMMRYKWYRRIRLGKKKDKGFPSFIKKTDEERIQNMPWVLENKEPMVVTEKIDGSSITMVLMRKKSVFPWKKKYEYVVCSRNLRLSNDGNKYWQCSDRYSVPRVLENIIGKHEWVSIQGEMIAEGVQKNKYHVSTPDVYVFNLIYPTGRMGTVEAKKIIEDNGMKFVPVLDENYILPDTVDEMLDYAHGESKLYPTLREGVVIRSKDGKRSFKAVDPLFLIKHGE